MLSRDTTTVAAKPSGVLETLVVSVAMGSIGYDLEKSLVRCHPAIVWNFIVPGHDVCSYTVTNTFLMGDVSVGII